MRDALWSFRHQACCSLPPARPGYMACQTKRLCMLVSAFAVHFLSSICAEMYSMLVILRMFSCTKVESGHVVGPLPRIGHPLSKINPWFLRVTEYTLFFLHSFSFPGGLKLKTNSRQKSIWPTAALINHDKNSYYWIGKCCQRVKISAALGWKKTFET